MSVNQPSSGGVVPAVDVPVLQGARQRVDGRVAVGARGVVHRGIEDPVAGGVDGALTQPQHVGGQEELEEHPGAVTVAVGRRGREPDHEDRVGHHARVGDAGDLRRDELVGCSGGEVEAFCDPVALGRCRVHHRVVGGEDLGVGQVVAHHVGDELERLPGDADVGVSLLPDRVLLAQRVEPAQIRVQRVPVLVLEGLEQGQGLAARVVPVGEEVVVVDLDEAVVEHLVGHHLVEHRVEGIEAAVADLLLLLEGRQATEDGEAGLAQGGDLVEQLDPVEELGGRVVLVAGDGVVDAVDHLDEGVVLLAVPLELETALVLDGLGRLGDDPRRAVVLELGHLLEHLEVLLEVVRAPL